MTQRTFYRDIYSSPIGKLIIMGNDKGVAQIHFANDEPPLGATNKIPTCITTAFKQLDEYFASQRTTFDVPLFIEGTAFQQKVWQYLITIGYGQTRSYHDIAHHLGDDNLVRAVGQANGRNPLPIIIPCHRVVGADGSLTGYAGGLWRKKWLLDFEHKQTSF